MWTMQAGEIMGKLWGLVREERVGNTYFGFPMFSGRVCFSVGVGGVFALDK